MPWVSLDPAAVVDLVTWGLTKCRDEAGMSLWRLRSESKTADCSCRGEDTVTLLCNF